MGGGRFDPNRGIQGMRRIAPLLLLAGAIIVGGFILAVLQGRPIPAPSLVFFILGGGILAASIRILLPSYPRALRSDLANWKR
jgi:hypothetical protein